MKKAIGILQILSGAALLAAGVLTLVQGCARRRSGGQAQHKCAKTVSVHSASPPFPPPRRLPAKERCGRSHVESGRGRPVLILSRSGEKSVAKSCCFRYNLT